MNSSPFNKPWDYLYFLLRPVKTMSFLRKQSLPLILLWATRSLCAIGPVTDLNIVNIDASPDGFARTAISAGGDGVVGSLITGNKVGL